MHDDMLSLMNSKSDYFDNLPEDSFRQLFWSQQLKAASQKNARCMKWHPLMIRWCRSLRHRLSIKRIGIILCMQLGPAELMRC